MPNYPHVSVDLRHRALSVILNDALIAGTLELDDAHLVDVDAAGRPVSIEILTLDNWKLEEMGAKFGFSDQVPAISAAINDILRLPTGTAVSYGQPIVVTGKVVAGDDTESEAHSDTPMPWRVLS